MIDKYYEWIESTQQDIRESRRRLSQVEFEIGQLRWWQVFDRIRLGLKWSRESIWLEDLVREEENLWR